MKTFKADRNAKIHVTCENCGHNFEKTIGWLEKNNNYPCPNGCGAILDSTNDIKKFDKAVTNGVHTLSKAVQGLNKKLNS